MQAEDDIYKRLFVVGCSRSGTTLLQVSVASHPRIQSFPETFVFQQSTGYMPRFIPWIGLATGYEVHAFRELLKTVKRPDLAYFLPEQPRCYKKAARNYIRVFDRIATDNGKDLWLEKSPLHVHYIGLIQQYVPRAHFIHILRDGRDVVASICHRARTHEGKFDGQEDPAFGVRRWNRALKASRLHLGRPGHSFVLYEQLVKHPEQVMRHICRDVGIAYHDRMATGDQETAAEIIPQGRDWIEGATEPPTSKVSKFETVLDESERRRITAQLDLDIYERLASKIKSENYSPAKVGQSIVQWVNYWLADKS